MVAFAITASKSVEFKSRSASCKRSNRRIVVQISSSLVLTERPSHASYEEFVFLKKLINWTLFRNGKYAAVFTFLPNRGRSEFYSTF